MKNNFFLDALSKCDAGWDGKQEFFCIWPYNDDHIRPIIWNAHNVLSRNMLIKHNFLQIVCTFKFSKEFSFVFRSTTMATTLSSWRLMTQQSTYRPWQQGVSWRDTWHKQLTRWLWRWGSSCLSSICPPQRRPSGGGERRDLRWAIWIDISYLYNHDVLQLPAPP